MITIYIELGVIVLGLVMILWGLMTGDPAQHDVTEGESGEPRGVPRHAHWVGEGNTERLRPPAPRGPVD